MARPRHFAMQNDGSAETVQKLWRDLANANMYYLYILLNEANTKTYAGVSDNVNKRLEEHNAGKVKSSRPYRPYKVIYTELFATLSQARQREKFYKSTTGRRKLREMFFK